MFFSQQASRSFFLAGKPLADNVRMTIEPVEPGAATPVVLAMPASKHSATGTRTRVARVRAEYPNQLDYSGRCTVGLEGLPSAAKQHGLRLAVRTRRGPGNMHVLPLARRRARIAFARNARADRLTQPCISYGLGGRGPGVQEVWNLHMFMCHHRSHFGSRYTLGCCGHAGLFIVWQHSSACSNHDAAAEHR